LIFLNLALGLVLALAAILLPGAVITFVRLVYAPASRKRLRPLDWTEWLTYSLGYGLVSVGSIAFILVGFLGIFFKLFVTVPLLAAIAGVIVGLGLAWIWWVEIIVKGKCARDLPGAAVAWRKVVRRAPLVRPVLVLALCVFLLYLFNFSRYSFDEERCLIRAAVLPVHNYLRSDTPMSWTLPQEAVRNNAFLHWNGGQRLGSAVFSGLSLALFGFAGFRVVHALTGLLIFLGGFLGAREVTGRPGASLVGALALALSPYLLQIDVFDENLLAAAVASLMLPLLLRERRDIIAAAALFALLAGTRHVAIVWMPGLLAFLWFTAPPRKRVAELAAFAGVALLFMSPYIYKHARDISLYALPYESFLSNPPAVHSFIGIEFEWRGLLNWPFVSDMVRSPFSPYPPALAFPLAIADRFGLLLSALLVTGLIRNLLRRRAVAWLLLSLYVPVAAILAVQSNWIEPAKMYVLVTVMAPFSIWIASGIAWVTDRKSIDWLRYSAPVLALFLTWTAVQLCAGLDFPLDQRNLFYRKVYLAGFPRSMLDEMPEQLESRRRELADGNFLPSLQSVPLFKSTGLAKRRVRHLFQDLTWPSADDMQEPMTNRFRRIQGFAPLMHFPVTSMTTRNQNESPKIDHSDAGQNYLAVSLDLTKPLAARSDFVTISQALPENHRLEPGGALIVRGLHLPWADRNANLVLVSDQEKNVSALLLFEPPGQGKLDAYGVPGGASDGFLPPGGPGRMMEPPDEGAGRADFPSPEELARELGAAADLIPLQPPSKSAAIKEVEWPERVPAVVTIDLPAGALLDFSEVTSFAPNLNFTWYVDVDRIGPVKLAPPIPKGM